MPQRSPSRILVTGATGFIGRQALPLLTSRGYEVHAVSTRPPALAGSGVHWHACDLLDPALAGRLVAALRPTHLLHLAWYAVPGRYWTAPENETWLEASLALADAFAAAGGRRMVTAGTCAEYDWTGDGVCREGVTPLRPATRYGQSKHALREALEARAKAAGWMAAWGRVFFVYGPHEAPGRLTSSVATSLLHGEPASCTLGLQRRDFLHVADVASAFVALLESGVEGPVNIASGEAVAVADVVRGLAVRLGRPDLVRLGDRPTPPNDPPLLVADVARLRDEVGWRPRFDLESGLDDTADWWRGAIGPATEGS